MVADGGDEGAAIKDIPGVVEEAVPVIALVAPVHEVAGEDVEGGVGALAEGGVNEAAPAVEAVLHVAHVDEGERDRPGGGGGELAPFTPAGARAVADSVDVGGARFEAGKFRGMPVDGGIAEETRVVEEFSSGGDPAKLARVNGVEVGTAAVSDVGLADLGAGAPLDGLGGLRIPAPGEQDLIGSGRAGVFGPAEDAEQAAVIAAAAERADEFLPLDGRGIVARVSSRSA
ncbi:MAG: hypothetical protein M5U12_37525 [Verrucomicrobia bacterium]|nr:hypothetical protein [Verrucomicrobiota bacterium]